MSGAPVALELDVNGEVRSAAVRVADTLLAVLRERLALTGAKRGCDQGVCGACTVLIDGAPQRACLRLAVDCAGQRIVTVEGLAAPSAPTVLQRAFVDHGAIQCGFCTPGMIVTLSALLARKVPPDAAEIREAIAGHLCRCSGYVKALAAASWAATGAER